MDVIYIWIHCNLVYVRWVHEIFAFDEIFIGQEAGSKGIMPNKHEI